MIFLNKKQDGAKCSLLPYSRYMTNKNLFDQNCVELNLIII